MLSDPISDMLTRIRNAYMAGKRNIVLPSSKIKVSIANILKNNGYIGEIKESGDKKKELAIILLYKDKKSAIQNIKRVSKPGRRIYASVSELPTVLNGYGIAIISTSTGIMTNKDAKKQKIGGEIICEVY
ncbi:30S ribosomal protein S8 [Patescibacteria group bacterium]|nr:30S ribosomal protein S8 [Patescibacteria group bacterium]